MIMKSFVAGLALLGIVGFAARLIPSSVRVERTFNAPTSKVWMLWTNAESIKKWWSPKDFTAPVVENDFSVGGKFLLSMKSPKGEMFWNAGHYTDITPMKKIVSQLYFYDDKGNMIKGSDIPVPGKWPDSLEVVVQFKDIDGTQTTVTVEEKGIPLIMKPFSVMGWKQQLDKFEALL